MNSDNEGVIQRNYTDANRAFIQAFLARGTLTFPDAQELLAQIFTVQDDNRRVTDADSITRADFESFVTAAATALSPFDYSIRSSFHQTTRERIWALINTTSDPLTQLATTRSADELAFIKRLLDLLFETNNTKRQETMACTANQALKVAKAPLGGRRESTRDEGEVMRPKDNSITQSQAEKLLEELVTENWLEKSAEEFYSLSPRALLELRSWLVATYNEEDAEEGEWQRIKNCVSCKEIVTVGQRCEDRECNIRLHDICEEGYWKTQAGRRGAGTQPPVGKRCPSCSREWKGKSLVGERVLTMGERWIEGRQKSRLARRVMEEVQDEEVQNDEGGGEEGKEDAEGEMDEDGE